MPRREDWWADGEGDEVEEHRTAVMTEELEGLIRFLETLTGKHFSMTRLGEIMHKGNQETNYYQMGTDLAATIPCPISWTDALANVSAALYFRGTDWGVEHARQYYEEIKERADKKLGVCDPEKVRLDYWGHPVWFSLGFYNNWEEQYGAVFLPLYYYSGTERKLAYDLTDPLRTLAMQTVRTANVGRNPTLLKKYLVFKAQKYSVTGTIFMVVESCKLLYASVLFGREALEKAGYPTLEINADMVDSRDWDDTKMKALVTSFIETLIA